MIALLDTHVWLWLHTAPERLGVRAREMLADPGNRRLLSSASAWEIAIKYSAGRLPLPDVPARYLPIRMERSLTDPLAIDHAHAIRVAELPFHHRDPFDRLLIAQAQVEGIPIVTADRAFDAYDVEVIRATD